MVFIHTTCANEKEAEKLGEMIVDYKMGACVEYWPVKSIYNWQGKRENRNEVMMTITTFESKLEEVNDLISKNHSYSTPMIAGVDVRRINRAYKEWMTQSIT